MKKEDTIPDYVSESKSSFPKPTVDILKPRKSSHDTTIAEQSLYYMVEAYKDTVKSLNNQINKLDVKLTKITEENTNLKVENTKITGNQRYSPLFEGLKGFSGIIMGVLLGALFNNPNNYPLYFVFIGFTILFVAALKFNPGVKK